MILMTTEAAGSVGSFSFGQDGEFWRSRIEFDSIGYTQKNQITMPSGFVPFATRPSVLEYGNRVYYMGVGTDDLVFDEHFRLSRQGIQPPDQIPVLAATTGPGRTGACVVAIAYYDEFTDEWSQLSGSSNSVSLSNQAAAITNVQVPTESRVTHVGVWVSMDGADFRLSTKRQVGVTSITEAVATLSLGISFFDTFTRMPRGAFGAIFHDRLCKAGTDLAPDTLYVSAIGFPERYEGLSFSTRNSEPIVGVIGARDVLLVMTPRSAYVLRGWLTTDMSLTLLDAEMGSIGHFTMAIAGGNAWVPNDQGVFLFNGAFQNVLRERQTEWKDRYKLYAAEFEAGFAFVDPNDYTYNLVLNGDFDMDVWAIPDDAANFPQMICWVANYKPTVPEVSGTFAQPTWTLDVRVGQIHSAGLVGFPGGKRGDIYFGTCDDGNVYKRSATNGDDAGDNYGKDMWIRTGALYMAEPGGDDREGKHLVRAWSYIRSESSSWIVYIQGGDEDAYLQVRPNNTEFFWMGTAAASAGQITRGDFTYTFAPQSVHPHVPENVSGRAFTFEYKFHSPVNVSFRGVGGVWEGGEAARGIVSVAGEG